jgi:hypothetical protein
VLPAGITGQRHETWTPSGGSWKRLGIAASDAGTSQFSHGYASPHVALKSIAGTMGQIDTPGTATESPPDAPRLYEAKHSPHVTVCPAACISRLDSPPDRCRCIAFARLERTPRGGQQDVCRCHGQQVEYSSRCERCERPTSGTAAAGGQILEEWAHAYPPEILVPLLRSFLGLTSQTRYFLVSRTHDAAARILPAPWRSMSQADREALEPGG